MRYKAWHVSLLILASTTLPALASDARDRTVTTYTGDHLEVKGGVTTVTGDNSSRSWYTVVYGGALHLAPGASVGAGKIEVMKDAVFAPLSRAGGNVHIPQSICLHDGAVLDLSGDGVISTYTFDGSFNPDPGAGFKIIVDVGENGPDRLVFRKFSNASAMKDYVVLRLRSKTVRPGTFILATTVPQASVIENHFGFDFTGDAANHANIVKTKVQDGYRFTLDSMDKNGKPNDYSASGDKGDYYGYSLRVGEPP